MDDEVKKWMALAAFLLREIETCPPRVDARKHSLQMVRGKLLEALQGEVPTPPLRPMTSDEVRRFPGGEDSVVFMVLSDFLADHGMLALLPQSLIDAVKKAEERWRSIELVEEGPSHLLEEWPHRTAVHFEGLRGDGGGTSRAEALAMALADLSREVMARSRGERLPTSTPPDPRVQNWLNTARDRIAETMGVPPEHFGLVSRYIQPNQAPLPGSWASLYGESVVAGLAKTDQRYFVREVPNDMAAVRREGHRLIDEASAEPCAHRRLRPLSSRGRHGAKLTGFSCLDCTATLNPREGRDAARRASKT